MSDSSRPPASDLRSTQHDGEESLEQRVTRYRGDERATASDVVVLTDRVDALEQLVGRPPSALPGDRGWGLAQHFVDLTLSFGHLTAAMGTLRDSLTTAVTALRDSIDAERRARTEEAAAKTEEAAKAAAAKTEEAAKLAARREPWSRVAWLAIGGVITVIAGAAAGGAYHWLSTLHH